MDRAALAERLLAAARARPGSPAPPRKAEAEGGCGVVGVASSATVPGRCLLQALAQMRNRGNGKGGGLAAAGLDPAFLGVDRGTLLRDHLIAVAYLDPTARAAVEAEHLAPAFEVDHVAELPWTPLAEALAVRPPRVVCYLARVRPEVREAFGRAHGIPPEHRDAIDDEVVFQRTDDLNRACYSATGERRAFVLSRGRDLLVVKLVGYGDDAIRAYGLEGLRAHVWIGHHRYPTKGRVWHPGGAHPFVGLNEALVHNGDFANYASICAYLAQRGRSPLFLTDTEVAALLFDLLTRVHGYPLEHAIEALAPTTERDFALLPEDRRRTYRMLQAVHIHGSPDGPWFFLIARSDPREGTRQLIGITDTSMLRPQVFALQRGREAVGLAASERQAIDAVLESLAREDPGTWWPRADRYWNARGGSHTDGGAFVFTVRPGERGAGNLVCTDKFGRVVEVDPGKEPPPPGGLPAVRAGAASVAADRGAAALARSELPAAELVGRVRERLPAWGPIGAWAFLEELVRGATDDPGRERAFEVLALLIDRPVPIGAMKRSALLALLDAALAELVDGVRARPSARFRWAGPDRLPDPDGAAVVVDARGFPSEGPGSLARAIVELHRRGARRFLVANCRGQRFIGCGLGPATHGVRIDVFGPSGDYLASGIDGAEVVVHGAGQDQLAQIMKDGRLVVHGDVGQTFGYAAKGGEVFVLGNAAGRPLINAVGRPRVVINGTCLDYLAESFMAGDPLAGGGFVVVNGLALDEDGGIHDLDDPYPGGNLFSLASGGAVYVRDPRGRLGEDQLNGGEFAPFGPEDLELLLPYLEENERLFGIPVRRLLTVDGEELPPERVYRKIRPAAHHALTPEEAWVKREA
ncbi:MAG TPA: glutamate synthase [Actinomycetota bacterium]|nr:glutamate synthase [Actinomycetota bacterium]